MSLNKSQESPPPRTSPLPPTTINPPQRPHMRTPAVCVKFHPQPQNQYFLPEEMREKWKRCRSQKRARTHASLGVLTPTDQCFELNVTGNLVLTPFVSLPVSAWRRLGCYGNTIHCTRSQPWWSKRVRLETSIMRKRKRKNKQTNKNTHKKQTSLKTNQTESTAHTSTEDLQRTKKQKKRDPERKKVGNVKNTAIAQKVPQ